MTETMAFIPNGVKYLKRCVNHVSHLVGREFRVRKASFEAQK